MSKKAYRQVMVGTDFSDSSERAVVVAKRVAQRLGGHVTVVHVYKPGPFYQGIFPGSSDELEERIAETAQKELDALAARSLSGVSADVVAVSSRSAADAFCDEAARVNADLCVVGTHGRAGVERFFIGSVAEKIVRHAPCDVLTVPPDAEAPVPFVDRVLLATDFSDTAMKAAEAASSIAVAGTEFLCVHVFDDTIPVVLPSGGFESTAQTSERLARELENWQSQVFGSERSVTGEIIAGGNADAALTQRASEWKAELIVVGSRGRSAVAHLLIGSVAERTIRHAPCAVLCVRG
jgi:nucleotide-binding universal stress UspA family protein